MDNVNTLFDGAFERITDPHLSDADYKLASAAAKFETYREEQTLTRSEIRPDNMYQPLATLWRLNKLQRANQKRAKRLH